jgi:hypothetical protein
VESVLRGPVEVENAFLNSSNTVEDRGSKGLVILDASMKVLECLNLWELILLGVCGP